MQLLDYEVFMNAKHYLVSGLISLGLMAHTQQRSLFTQIKPLFAYVNVRTLTNKELGYGKGPLVQSLDSASAAKLFRHSQMFSPDDRPPCYAFNQKKGYYQLIFTRSSNYRPDLVLMHFTPDGKLMAELTVASAFFDAGLGTMTRSKLTNDSTLVVGELELSERPPNTPCDSVATVYRINKNGSLRLLYKKAYKISCDHTF
jgi:hypothetical protein